MNAVADDFQGKQIEPRRRKLAVAHQNNTIIVDANGNSNTLQRLDSVSETIAEVSSQWIDVESNEAQDRSSVVWDNSVLQQIQSLIKNVQVSESLAEYINKEILNEDVNANVGPRSRRKSCFTLSNDIHSQTSRRQSVASMYQNKSKSLPRTNLNDEMFNHFKQAHQRRRSSVAYVNDRRISNAGQNQSRRSSVVQYNSGRRRSSVLNPTVQNQGQNCRRSSIAQIKRRSSLAHAYQHGSMPAFRRMSSVNDNELSVPVNSISQRRRSSVKPPCFPVTKISSVQKRLHRIYNKRRRRQDRAEVKLSDVRKAFRGLSNEKYSDGSGSEDSAINDNNNLTSDSEHEVSDESRDICNEEIISLEKVAGIETDLNNKRAMDDVTDNVVHSEELKHNPRRKTSIQVRSWELSRKLRQRRREKRKGFTESNLI